MSAQQQEVLVLMDLSQFSFGALHSHEESSLPQITLVLYDSLHPMVCVCVCGGVIYTGHPGSRAS